MAILTLVIGLVLFGIGIVGQVASLQHRPASHPHDRARARSVAMIAAIVVGFWLLALSVVHLLHMHHQALHASL